MPDLVASALNNLEVFFYEWQLLFSCHAEKFFVRDVEFLTCTATKLNEPRALAAWVLCFGVDPALKAHDGSKVAGVEPLAIAEENQLSSEGRRLFVKSVDGKEFARHGSCDTLPLRNEG